MKKLWKWLGKFFCLHDWECSSGFEICDPRPVMFRCRKCGKEEGL